MKSAIILVTALFSINSLACDSILGTWQCTSDKGEKSQETYTKTADGIVFTAVDAGGAKSPAILTDGKEHQADVDGLLFVYTAKLVCNGNSVTTDMKFTTSYKNDRGTVFGTTGTTRSQVTVNGNDMTYVGNGTAQATADGQVVVDSKDVNKGTCTKQ